MRIEVVLGADRPIVSFRAVDVDHRPLSSVAIELARRKMFGFPSSSRVDTDPEGRFIVDGEGSTQFEGGCFLVTYRPQQGSRLQGRAYLPDVPSVGWNDGGDVVLEAEPFLCAGLVVDDGKHPVPGAGVIAGVKVTFGRSFPGDTNGQVCGMSDEHGRFVLRGLLDEDGFDLHAELNSLRSDTVRAVRGDQSVELVLLTRYTVSGRLFVDPEIDTRSIKFQLQLPNTAPATAYRRPDGDDGRFALDPIPAGDYELTCLLDGQELARLEGLSVRENLDVGDIDLRGRIYSCEIVLIGAEEPSKLTGEILWWPVGRVERHRGRIEGNLIQILTPNVPIDVAVRPREYRGAVLERVSGRRELVLEPPLHVKLVLRTDGEFPELPFVLRGDLRQDGVPVGAPQGMPYFTKENQEIAFLVSAAGKVRVHWHLERRVDGANVSGSISGDVLQEHEVQIEVLDVPGEQVFPIELDGAALTALSHNPPWK